MAQARRGRGAVTAGKKSDKAGRGAIPAPLFCFQLTLEYDGTGFDGWQAQPGRRTVQAVLEAALRRLFKARVTTVAAGRTDAGVHALAQAVTFRAPRAFPGDLAAALNHLLPEDMAVLSAKAVPPGTHARRDAAWKTYRYTLLNRAARPALDRSRVHWVARPLDAAAMARAARGLIGKRDFAAFGAPPFPGGSVCALRDCRVVRAGDLVRIDVTGDRFLKHMVRRLAGRLVQAGWGARDPKPLTLPARGLALVKVIY
jgi:tRNA pseudouridine38-40 synthase